MIQTAASRLPAHDMYAILAVEWRVLDVAYGLAYRTRETGEFDLFSECPVPVELALLGRVTLEMGHVAGLRCDFAYRVTWEAAASAADRSPITTRDAVERLATGSHSSLTFVRFHVDHFLAVRSNLTLTSRSTVQAMATYGLSTESLAQLLCQLPTCRQKGDPRGSTPLEE